MDEWTPKLKLPSVLTITKELLLRSMTGGWSAESLTEAAETIDKGHLTRFGPMVKSYSGMDKLAYLIKTVD